jgi:cytochrome c oxidase accessory protein FixG
VIGYDEKRGEPRGKASKGGSSAAFGDCVDCKRCVVVCPTGIDIRQGLQLDCIACTACIDACDDVMDRLGRRRGLIRWDSLRGLRGEARRFLRPRVWGYSALLLVGLVVSAFALRKHEPFEANVVRLAGLPYTREGGVLRNAFELHLVNKRAERVTFDVLPDPAADLTFVVPMQHVEIEPLADRRIPIFVSMDPGRFTADRPFEIAVRTTGGGASAEQRVRAVFLGAR